MRHYKRSSSLIFLTSLMLGASTAFAQTTPTPTPTTSLTVVSFSNYFYTPVSLDSTTGAYNIYAGSTASACASGADQTNSTCDSCAGSAVTIHGSTGIACNTNQINSGLLFTITLSSTDATSYTACSTPILLIPGATSTGTNITPSLVSTYTPGATGQSVTASFTWSSLCSAVNGDSNCTTSFPLTAFRVGFNASCAGTMTTSATIQIAFRYVASSGMMTFGCGTDMGAFEGVCGYSVYPGDGKIYLNSLEMNTAQNLQTGNASGTSASFDSTGHPSAADPSLIQYAGVRMFYAPVPTGTDPLTGVAETMTTAAQAATLNITTTSGTGDYTIGNSTITGLTNGQQYVFVAASVDQAGNVENFAEPSALSFAQAPLGGTQSTSPEPVYGLLDNQHCFIATAAFGSGDDSSVVILRKFRNRYLLGWEGGRSFVRTYYKLSPPIAQFISQREWLKVAVREALKPFVVTAVVGLRYGMWAVLCLALLSGALFFGIIAWLRHGREA